MFPFNEQGHIGGGGSRAEGLQGPARLLCGTPGQVLALPLEVCTVLLTPYFCHLLNFGDLHALGQPLWPL